jgi:hypothetical protein
MAIAIMKSTPLSLYFMHQLRIKTAAASESRKIAEEGYIFADEFTMNHFHYPNHWESTIQQPSQTHLFAKQKFRQYT